MGGQDWRPVLAGSDANQLSESVSEPASEPASELLFQTTLTVPNVCSLKNSIEGTLIKFILLWGLHCGRADTSLKFMDLTPRDLALVKMERIHAKPDMDPTTPREILRRYKLILDRLEIIYVGGVESLAKYVEASILPYSSIYIPGSFPKRIMGRSIKLSMYPSGTITPLEVTGYWATLALLTAGLPVKRNRSLALTLRLGLTYQE
ncbi:hypothetical protein C8J57DRAFT_1232238 [Mycena rebaudengoi]|nr:hypothetical protein C8J57DRAFT_1232238 [Mycena rebaudengoi]